jgi:hypothetical protein
MTLFDAYLMVDWSASSKPKSGKDSIWIALAVRVGERVAVEALENPRTRTAAAARVNELVRSLITRGLRVLTGFDFPYGYPRGLATALGLSDDEAPWRVIWNRFSEAIRDDARNVNNRFGVASNLNAKLGLRPGPFWGCPAPQQTATLRSKGCSFPYDAPGRALERRRTTERRLRGVQETWKLFGRGSAGSQALLGIPRVAALRDDETLAPVSRVWPFETGFTNLPTPQHGPFVLHAEIWPGVVPIDASLHTVRDTAQVLTLTRHFAALDDLGEAQALFRAPDRLGADELAACVAEEGWILGA